MQFYRPIRNRGLCKFTYALFLASWWSILASQLPARERQLIDESWKFHLGDLDGSQTIELDTSTWRRVDLPHDWSIELLADEEAPCGGAGGFFPTGIGWYRREFTVPEGWRDQRVTVEFEGVYENAEVWLNEVYLGKHHYGYTPFQYDVTPYLKPEGSNSLAVRVDNAEQPNCRWYSGSGIYRHVWLTATSRLRLDPREVAIVTQSCNDELARVDVTARVFNDLDEHQKATLLVEIDSLDGKVIQKAEIPCTIPARDSQEKEFHFEIEKPVLWSPESPQLHSAKLKIVQENKVIDEISVDFGIRTIEVSSDEGLRINDVPVLLCGANVHHDNGPLGAAAFDRAEFRRVELLKEAGFNAIRTAHNPPSTAFLVACDRLGMLVVEDAFDGWEAKKTPHDYGKHFAENWRSDLLEILRRDRNHPSIIMWSIGNEMYERGNDRGLTLTRELAEEVKKHDRSRPVTAAVNGLGNPDQWAKLDPLFEVLDVAGYNYELHRHEQDHRRLPQRVIMATETYPKDAIQGWSVCAKENYVVGEFVWSGIDYLGEAGIGRVFGPGEKLLPHWEGNHYPWHGAACGDLDITGWRKPMSHYRNIIWDRGEKLFLAVSVPHPNGGQWQPSLWSPLHWQSHWTWPDHIGKKVDLEICSRYPMVRVYLNDQLIGEEQVSEESEFHCTLSTEYHPGTLRLVGIEEGREVEECVLKTAGEPHGIRLTPDRSSIDADGQDLCFIKVEVVDESGEICPQSDAEIEYSVEGSVTIAAIGSGDLTSRESYRQNPRSVFQGRALVVVRVSNNPGEVTLKASSAGLEDATVAIGLTTQVVE